MLRPLLHLACLALVSTVLGAGCSSDGDAANETAETDDDLKLGTTLTEADEGRTVAVVEGQSVLVALAANPTTGYGWVVTSTDKTFGYPTTKYVKSSAAVGGGGTTKLTWATTGGLPMVGKHTVKLGYRRSWENVDIKTFTFTVDIRSAGPTKAVELDDADNGAVVVAKTGQNVVLSLLSNPTTGFKWSVTATDKSFGYGSETYKGSGSGAVGAGGVQVFTWKTTAPFSLAGTHKVTLQYRREGDATAAKTFSFTVKIQN